MSAELRAAFMARSQPMAGGHRRWTGWADDRGMPMLFVDGVRYTAARAGFLIAEDRPPVGYVKPVCGWSGCVEPDHLGDRLVREELRAQERQREADLIDMTAVTRALHGSPPFPPLTPAEKQTALALADPSTPTAALARRVGCAWKTARRRRTRGAVV